MSTSSNYNQSYFDSFKNGDQKAFAYFYEYYFNAIKNFCLSFVYDLDEAENITQEAFIYLWNNRSQVTSVNGIPSFLYTLAKSKCLNSIRHQKVKDKYTNHLLNEKERTLDFEILHSLSFDVLEIKELEKKIDNVINQLPAATRDVFIKKRIENKKNSEIAAELNISVKTVEAHMTKALKLLRQSLLDYFIIAIHFYL